MDFTKMRFRIDELPEDKDVIDVFPELAEYDEFTEDDTLLRIALYATDEGSPFLKVEREDYERRLVKIFDYMKLKDPALLQKLNSGTNQVYEAMVNRYFMFCDNLAYVMWSNKLRMFHNVGMALRQPLDTMDMVKDMQNRSTLDKHSQLIYTDLLDYESQVFSDIPTRKKLRKQVAKLFTVCRTGSY